MVYGKPLKNKKKVYKLFINFKTQFNCFKIYEQKKVNSKIKKRNPKIIEAQVFLEF